MLVIKSRKDLKKKMIKNIGLYYHYGDRKKTKQEEKIYLNLIEVFNNIYTDNNINNSDNELDRKLKLLITIKDYENINIKTNFFNTNAFFCDLNGYLYSFIFLFNNKKSCLLDLIPEIKTKNSNDILYKNVKDYIDSLNTLEDNNTTFPDLVLDYFILNNEQEYAYKILEMMYDKNKKFNINREKFKENIILDTFSLSITPIVLTNSELILPNDYEANPEDLLDCFDPDCFLPYLRYITNHINEKFIYNNISKKIILKYFYKIKNMEDNNTYNFNKIEYTKYSKIFIKLLRTNATLNSDYLNCQNEKKDYFTKINYTIKISDLIDTNIVARNNIFNNDSGKSENGDSNNEIIFKKIIEETNKEYLCISLLNYYNETYTKNISRKKFIKNYKATMSIFEKIGCDFSKYEKDFSVIISTWILAEKLQ